MSKTNFDACIDIILVYEGGLSMIRSDPGNWTGGKVGRGALRGTTYGIAASSHPTLDIANLTRDGAKTIYRSNYWNKVGGDTLARGVDLVTMDAAVNSGPGQAVKWLRTAQGKADTAIGVMDALCAYRLSFLHALGTWRAFGRGWGARVADVEAKAHRMALGTGPAAKSIIQSKAAMHKTRAMASSARAKATALAGPSAGGGAAAFHGHPAIIATLVLLGLAGAGILAFTAWRNSQRATALAAETATPSVTTPLSSTSLSPITSKP